LFEEDTKGEYFDEAFLVWRIRLFLTYFRQWL